jgi:hypothetical protein
LEHNEEASRLGACRALAILGVRHKYHTFWSSKTLYTIVFPEGECPCLLGIPFQKWLKLQGSCRSKKCRGTNSEGGGSGDAERNDKNLDQKGEVI